ncbi:FtsX-like permease family protein [Nocardioides sp.]|uniref:FtsX-like permease family protein n=1 Tax=Nocardioides sp. TaxID=35761 RepID=UPI003D107643
MWKLVRYRRLQAITIAFLAALITACAVFAPLYDRATQQALVDLQLAQAPVQVSGLSIEGAWPAVAVPRSVSRQFETPVQGARGIANVLAGAPATTGTMLWRDGFCDHVEVIDGRCPTDAGEIMVSEADAEGFGLAPGRRITVAGDQPIGESTAPDVHLVVVGVYAEVPSAFWFGTRLTGLSGILDQGSPPQLQHDFWLADDSSFASMDLAALPQAIMLLDYTLDQSATGVDELLAMAPRLRTLERTAPTSGAVVHTGLPDIADQVAHQRDQSQVTIPLLMVQLGLLATVVFWLVLSAATEQRRPEVALALLRGRGRRGARRLLLSELLPMVLLGVPAGLVMAVALCWVTVTFFLPGSATVELRSTPALALVAAVVGLCVIAALAVWRVAREPVETLLRSVQSRRAGWRLGALETLVLTAAGTAVVAFLTGGLSGPIALAAPALLALVVGLLLAYATVPVSSVAGRRLLGSGRVRLGVSVLDAARSPGTRRMLAILTVATALLVFCTDALVVGDRNRADAAEQQAGAPLVAEVYGNDLFTVRSVLDDLDPDGSSVTPVVSIKAPAPDSPTTLAVLPSAFRRIALFPGQDPSDIPWSELASPEVEPIRLSGPQVSGLLTSRKLGVSTQDTEIPLTLTLEVVGATNEPFSVTVGELLTGNSVRPFSVDVPCRDGCVLSGLRFGTAPGSRISGSLSLSKVRAGGVPVNLGPGSAWQSVNDTETGKIQVRSAAPDTVTVRLATEGSSTSLVTHGWFPRVIPAITAGALPPGSDGDSFVGTGIDGLARAATRVASMPRVPATGPEAAVVNLDVVQRGANVDPENTIMLWFASDDEAMLAKVTDALMARGVAITSTTTLADQRRSFEQTTTAWSLQLAGVVGVAGLLIAVLVLLVIAATAWRLRSRDLAALRMTGLSQGSVRWIAVAEQLIAIVLAGVAGTVCGLVGAHAALPTVPLFATTPEVSTLDLTTAWVAVGAAAGGAVLLLLAVGWLCGEAIARRAVLDRVRESL